MDYKSYKKRLKEILKKSLKPDKVIKENPDALAIRDDGRHGGSPAYEPKKLGVGKPGKNYFDKAPIKGPGHKPNEGLTLKIVDVAPTPGENGVNYNLRTCHKDYYRIGDVIGNINTTLTQDQLSKVKKDNNSKIAVVPRNEE